jgi:hypothetical protein
LASAWSSSTAYTKGALVTLNNSIFLALSDNTNVQPGTSAATGVWMGAGANPATIPYTIQPHTLGNSVYYWSPVTVNTTAAVGPSNTVIVPITCTPSMTVYSLGPIAGTFYLYAVSTNTTNTIWSITGSAIMSCPVSASTGTPQSCSVTSSTTVAAGTVLTIQAPAQTSSGNVGGFSAFSCY